VIHRRLPGHVRIIRLPSHPHRSTRLAHDTLTLLRSFHRCLRLHRVRLTNTLSLIEHPSLSIPQTPRLSCGWWSRYSHKRLLSWIGQQRRSGFFSRRPYRKCVHVGCCPNWEHFDFRLVGPVSLVLEVGSLGSSHASLSLPCAIFRVAKVWKNFQLAYDLRGHQQSVWAVLLLEDDHFLTGIPFLESI
jgi:hypothetical protein